MAIEFPKVEDGYGCVELFHGSRGGIVGPIQPISRDRCDFGRGFYMGTEETQPLTLVCSVPEAVFYHLRLNLTGLKIASFQANLAWALFVAFGREKLEDMGNAAIYAEMVKLRADADVVSGPIANDRMFVVLDRFFAGTITDVALVESLSALKLGNQFVALTQRACDAIEIIDERRIESDERHELVALSKENRAEGIRAADEICRKHRRDGRFFDEILEELALAGSADGGAL